MAKKAKTNETENQDKKSIREVVNHVLPAEYSGRCEGRECYSAHPTFGGKLLDGEKLHKFEILLPIASDLDEFEALYGYTPKQAIERLTKAIYTDMDGEIKKALFNGITTPVDAQFVSPDAHTNAQAVADGWTYTPRQAGAKKTSVESVVATLVASGAISEADAAAIKTVDDLNRAIMNLNS